MALKIKVQVMSQLLIDQDENDITYLRTDADGRYLFNNNSSSISDSELVELTSKIMF